MPSLGGLRLASEMRFVRLSGTRLVNADALATLAVVDELTISETGLSDLDALSNLRSVIAALRIEDNAALQDSMASPDSSA